MTDLLAFNGVAFHVVGLPAPQGSKRHVGDGVMVESSKKVAPWREAVKWAAVQHRPAEPLDGPLTLHVVFTLPRPKTAPKRRRHPDRTPDLSKLVRSTEDALTDAGIWADDARVVTCRATKAWWRHHGLALPVPGCVLSVGPAGHPGFAHSDEWGAQEALMVAHGRALRALNAEVAS